MHTMNDVKLYDFREYGDENGHLVVIEGKGGNDAIPFNIKRVFYIYGSDRTVVRGKHANLKSEFVLVNVSGTSKVRVLDGEGNEAVYILNRPRTGIYLPSMVWKEMYDFSPDSVLLILASEHYDPAEYIRDYRDYENAIMNNQN